MTHLKTCLKIKIGEGRVKMIRWCCCLCAHHVNFTGDYSSLGKVAIGNGKKQSDACDNLVQLLVIYHG